MNQGSNTIIYPVKDVDQAKALFGTLLGVEPFVDEPFYVGYMVGSQQIGLDPHGHRHGMTAYFDVDDIRKTLQSLLDAGTQLVQDVTDVGGGKQIAIVKDASGSIIGLSQMS